MRSIVRTHQFEAELQDLIPHPPTADEFVEGAEFLLAGDPLTGCEIDARNHVWFMPMAPLGDLQLAIYYTFNQRQVIFLSLAAL